LFRIEATQARAARLAGDVIIAVPVSWQVIGYLFLVCVISAGAFVALGHYARVEAVNGVVVPDRGVVPVVPIRMGVIANLAVREGDEVPEGAEVATIRAEQEGSGGDSGATSSAARLQAALDQQDVSLAAQIVSTKASFAAQREQLLARRNSLTAEIAQLRSQIALQQRLVESSAADLDRFKTLAVGGMVSKSALADRENALLARQQGLAQLDQSLASKSGDLRTAEKQDAEIASQTRTQVESLAAARAQVAQQSASADSARVSSLRAPVRGRVTALTARVGQPASPQEPLMAIIPEGSTLQAELLVPSSAIGFIQPSQEVRLAIDAFPYQRFGTIPGRVQTVAASPIVKQAPNGQLISVYPVIVSIKEIALSAYGQQKPLLAGMTLTARITTERQSLIQWVLDPLFAVKRR